MNEILPDLPTSPTQVGNFVIAYEQEFDFITEDIKPDDLLHFIQADVIAKLFCGSDVSFFPRAITDSDLTDFSAQPEKSAKTEQRNAEEVQPAELEVKSDNTEDENKMDGHSGERNKFTKNFQPDVIISNSHQRSGPDGSPALLPSKSQGFLPSNLSETGELFAPVKTLTYSDIDQYSQVDDSCADSSRLVSTPDKGKPRSQYDYDMPGNYGAGNNGEDHQIDSDSDSDHIHIEPREQTPEFRQLEGEPDLDLMSTGAFQPSAHGLNQEFMDNFVGRTGNMYSMGSVFSPLTGGGNQAQERFEARTPPLHVPSANSPFVKQSGYRAPVENHEDPEEIQFQMSPTRNPTGSAKANKGYMMINRQEYMNSDRFYHSFPNEHTFEPIDKQPQNFMSQNTVPRNLNEYFEHDYKAQTSEVKTKTHNPKHDNRDVERTVNRQGDGHDHDLQEGVGNMMQMPDETDQQFAAVSPSAFEQRYLQRTQVSVKLPQATYDTMTSNTSHEERPDPDDQRHSRFEPSGLPPDSLPKEQYKMQTVETRMKASPAKVVDLLQMQTSNQNHEQYHDKITSNAGTKNDHAVKMNQNKTSSNVSDDDKPVKSEQDNSKHGDVVAESATGSSSVVVTSKTQLSQMGASKPQGQSQIRYVKQAGTQPPQISQQLAQAQQPSSRLLQETISKKSKVNQKYVSSNPAMSKTVPGQNKDLGKPQEPGRKNSNPSATTISAGARRTIMSESEKNTAAKSKSASMESLNQKPRTGQGQNAGRHGNKQDQNPSSQAARDGHLKRDPGHRDPGHGKVQGQRSPGVDPCEDGHVVTQVQTTSPVSVDLSERGVRESQNIGQSSLDVRGMEEVRSQLQSMLRLSHDTMSPQVYRTLGDSLVKMLLVHAADEYQNSVDLQSGSKLFSKDRSQYEHSDIVAGFGMQMGDQARQIDMSWNMASRKPPEEDVSEMFPSFSSSQFTVDSGNVSRSDASVHMENQRLRDMVDKERYRRKHCEQYIQQLNVKLLETQQQVAVAVSTDKRKDIMIEQLDKQLAVVMEGWKRRDVEKDALLDDMRKEKEDIETGMKQQQQMINNFEHDMSQAVDALRQEKETSTQAVEEMKEKLEETVRSRNHDKELLSAEQEKVDLLQQECDNLREGRDTLDKKLDNMQRRLHREQDEWFQREQELLQRIEEVSEKNTKILQIERTKNEEQGKLAEEVLEQYQAATTKIKQMEMELDAAMREKESVKVEMGIMEAKFENAQRVLEAEMHSTMEKQIAHQIADVQTRTEKTIEELQEKHRNQVVELNQRHGRELEKQLAVFREEVQKKEDDFRKQLNELESRLAEYRTENSELKLSKQKLESTRLEILTKLQYAMQSQWNEAFSLLSSTPQRKGPVPALQTDSVPASGSEVQSLPSVSFSFASPYNTSANQTSHQRTLTNHGTPPRSSANHSHTPDKSSSNQSSPERTGRTHSSPDRQRLANQMSPDGQTANRSSQNENQAKKGHFQLSLDEQKASSNGADLQSIETTTKLHMQQFQDYMNSVAQAPAWISTLNTQPSQLQELSERPSPTLPQPPDLAALLASHLHNMHQQQLQTSLASHPSYAHRTQLATMSHDTSAGIGVHDTHSKTLNQSTASSVNSRIQTQTPPKVTSLIARSANQSVMSESQVGFGQSSKGDMSHGWSLNPSGQGIGFGDAHDLSCAVPIRPPQQGEDPYLHDDDRSVISSIAGSQAGYFQGGQSFSPPTKQSRVGHDDSLEEIFTQHTSRLNEDYNHLSEKMEQHESHQNELQHYIQMLLHKPPSEAGQDDSMYSQEQEELDLNDTAQAAQLQRELDRIQELRQKQEMSAKTTESQMEMKGKPTSPASGDGASSNILNPQQMAEISTLLNQVKQQSDPNSSQVMELLELLKHTQESRAGQAGQEQSKGPKGRPGMAQAAGARDRNKGYPGTKRNVQFNPAKGVEGSKPTAEAQKSQSDKQPTKAAPPAKKVERKVAGSASKGDKGPKPAAWK